MTGYPDINARVVDSWVTEGWRWGQPIDHDTFRKAKEGDWQVVLTPTKPVPHSWFPPMQGAKVLGLASGGGQQMPVFAALGADCTVLDYSPKQLESERMVAAREGYAIHVVRHDMTRPLPFPDNAFDLIFHPVSNCYIEDVYPLWRECFRVLKPGGILLSGLDIGINYLFEDNSVTVSRKLPYNPLRDEALMREAMEKNDGVQFSHSLEEQVDGQLRAGFVLTNLFDDTNGEGPLEPYKVPAFIATRAVKPDGR